MNIKKFSFELPQNLIALYPPKVRDQSRMLVIKNNQNQINLKENTVAELHHELRKGDLLVTNISKVIPAFLTGSVKIDLKKVKIIKVNLIKQLNDKSWQILANPAKFINIGTKINFSDTLSATCSYLKQNTGFRVLNFNLSGCELDIAIKNCGKMPLPFYITKKREVTKEDNIRYQTIYAKQEGSVAAPTAGLHFTPSLLNKIRKAQIDICEITLHVGGGTFLPIKSDNIHEHTMHSEFGHITLEMAEKINTTRANGGRIVAVGTTSLRLLETATNSNGITQPFNGETDIYIKPGYKFNGADILLTNFHLPCSSLFVLVCAFQGIETMHEAYQFAINNSYNFYSYGDATLLFGKEKN